MAIAPAVLSVRFGVGRAPGIADPARPADLLDALAGPDTAAARYAIPSYMSLAPVAVELRALNKAIHSAPAAEAERLNMDRRAIYESQWDGAAQMLSATLARATQTRDPLRERLTWFWEDHFTVRSRGLMRRSGTSPFAADAIRPNLTGSFATMLRAAITHPLMLNYLDQSGSVGPNSALARSQPGRGLNENLAREVLELHTLGVDGAYTQNDVRQLAELLAGLVGWMPKGTRFLPRRGEPGPETILGRRYGRRIPKIEDVHQVLDALAVHPDTAHHIARKLAVHFVSDTPDEALIAHVATRFSETDGDLMQVYAALLEHPAAHDPALQKVKRPLEFVASSLRALGVPGAELMALDRRAVRRVFRDPLSEMGQPWQSAPGPDGWPEAAEHWISAHGLAARIEWAMALPGILKLGVEPSSVVEAALGPLATSAVQFAATAAETREEGIGLVLLSPEFQRR